MSLTSPVSRRTALAAALALAAGPAFAVSGGRRVITLLGDSITAGLGLPAAQALPARLQAEISRTGVPVLVRGAGVSGDTTAGGLARLAFSVQADTDLCVVALGANDLLRGLDVRDTEANLTRIVQTLKRRRMGVLVAGLTAPAVIGGGYARDFNAVFGRVARAQGVALFPNLLAGVLQNPQLNQRDGVHPNPQGVMVIARRLAPVVAQVLATRRA